MQTRNGLAYLKYVGIGILTFALLVGCQPPAVVPNPATPGPVQATMTLVPQVLLSRVTPKWTVKPGDHLLTTPMVVAGILYATLEDSCICAVDAQTGRVLWKVPPPGLRLTSPVVANGLIYVGMYADWQLEPQIKQTSYLYAFDARTGSGKWRFHGDRAEDEEASLPVVADGIVYLGTGHADGTGITPPAGLVSALDATTGQLLWQLKTSGSQEAGVAVGDGLVFFGDGSDYDFHTDRLHAVDAKTGQEKWTKPLADDLGSLPIVHDHLLYLEGHGQLIVLDTQTGQEKWHRALTADSFSSPVIGDGTLYFASNQQREDCIDNCPHRDYTDYLCAIDATTGNAKWTVTITDGSGPFNNLALSGGVLYQIGFQPNYLKARDAQTGKEEWQFDAEEAIYGAPAIADGVLYLGVSTGQLYALLPPGVPVSALTPRALPSASPDGSTAPTVPAASMQEAPARGFRAPDFTLDDVRTKQPVRLSALRGQPVFLNFWASWCPPCKEEMPEIEKLYAQYQGQVAFLGIASSSDDNLQTVTRYLDQGRFSWTFLYDPLGNVGLSYQVEAYPTSFFIDREGLIQAVHIGQLDQAELERNLQSIR